MSAFICNDYHISILAAAAANRYRCALGATPEKVGAMLYAANVQSIKARYPSDAKEHFEPFEFDNRALINSLDLSGVAILKACQCFAYQACEFEGWEKSEACQMINRIRAEAIGRLAGYDEAEWELTPKDTGGRVLLSSMVGTSRRVNI